MTSAPPSRMAYVLFSLLPFRVLSAAIGLLTPSQLFPRESQISCDPFGDKIQSYCDTGDTYCDLGTISGVHGSYLQRYSDAALDFVQEKLGYVSRIMSVIPATESPFT